MSVRMAEFTIKVSPAENGYIVTKTTGQGVAEVVGTWVEIAANEAIARAHVLLDEQHTYFNTEEDPA